jgi:hypothetical protein
MDAKLYGLLIQTARQRKTIAYSETGRSRAVIGPLLDEINRHEHSEARPLLSVIVVHKGTTEPGDMFFACATRPRQIDPLAAIRQRIARLTLEPSALGRPIPQLAADGGHSHDAPVLRRGVAAAAIPTGGSHSVSPLRPLAFDLRPPTMSLE